MSFIDNEYRSILRTIMVEGIEELNRRTGHRTKSVPGLNLRLDLQAEFPLVSLRRIPIKIFVAEQIWFIMGSRRPDEFLREFTRIWDEFTNIGGVVTSAYGYRMRHYFGRDQLGLLIELLEQDPSSRHGVVIFWDPADDGLAGSRSKKNVPCPYTFTVNIIGGRLHLHLVVRSNDMILGFPHDIGGFGLLAYLLAARLKVRPGILTYSISNAHVYDIHYGVARELLESELDHPSIEFSAKPDYFERAEQGDQTLVEEIVAQLKSRYQPAKSFKKLKIVI